MSNKTVFDGMVSVCGGSVEENSFRLYGDVMFLHKEEPLRYTSKWADSFRVENPDMYPAPVLGEESAFDYCVAWKILPRRVVEFKIYDNGFGGRGRGGLRCTFRVRNIPRKMLIAYVEREIVSIAFEKEEKEEQQRRASRRKQIYKSLMEKARDSVGLERHD